MSLSIAIAQINLTVGDLTGNLNKHVNALQYARDNLKADIIVFPELSLCGYPAEDLLLRPSFVIACEDTLQQLIQHVQGIYAVVGYPRKTVYGLENACAIIYNGEIIGTYAKQCLPNYGVFDERRYFIRGQKSCVIPIRNIPVGIVICEDLWNEVPAAEAVKYGAKLLLVPNASPFEVCKDERRQKTLQHIARQNQVPIIYVNCYGGQDDLVFDGGSMVFSAEGKMHYQAEFFKESVEVVTHPVTQIYPVKKILSEEERIYACLVLGMRDYFHKNNFKKAILGLSGGIDSALTLTIAVDALGKENIHTVMLPSRYASEMSKIDAELMANNLQVSYESISIESVFQSFLTTLEPKFKGLPVDITEQNLQARCRGMLLMALANKFNAIVLTTGNRSELAMGYTTLYGDMAGGFNVLKDIAKTLVYRLANYRNQISLVIPQRIIDRPPSAELAPGQKDEDSLPPYSLLDQILNLYIEKEKSITEIIAQGFDASIVKRVISLLVKNEYKRYQSPLGVRINHKNFGRDRRYPLTCGNWEKI